VAAVIAVLLLVVDLSQAGGVVVPRPVKTQSGTESSFEPASVSFVSPDVGFLMGVEDCPGQPSSTCTALLVTNDEGRHWNQVSILPAHYAPVAFQPGDGVSEIRFATPSIGYAFGPGLWVTTDAGASWKQIQLPGTANATQVVAALAASSAGVWFATVPVNAQGDPVGTASAFYGPPGRSTVAAVAKASGPGLGPFEMLSNGPAADAVIGANVYAISSAGSLKTIPNPCSGTSPLLGSLGGGSEVAACAGQGSSDTQAKQLFRLNGSQWTFDSDAPRAGQLEDLASAGHTVIISAQSNMSTLYVSTDSGGRFQTAIAVADGGVGFNNLQVVSNSLSVAIEGSPNDQNGASNSSRQPSLLWISRNGGRSFSESSV
jgi:hypothetical protein